jgi:hypothetical protein
VQVDGHGLRARREIDARRVVEVQIEIAGGRVREGQIDRDGLTVEQRQLEVVVVVGADLARSGEPAVGDLPGLCSGCRRARSGSSVHTTGQAPTERA